MASYSVHIFCGVGLLLLIKIAVWCFTNTTDGGKMTLKQTDSWMSMNHPSDQMHLQPSGDDPIHIIITACGTKDVDQYYHGAIDLLKTIQRYGGASVPSSDNDNAVLSENIIVHAFTDDVTKLALFVQKPSTFRLVEHLDIRVYGMPKPPKNPATGFDLFRKCASARLSTLALFENVGYHKKVDKKGMITNGFSSNSSLQGQNMIPDRILYLDSDSLVTTNLRKLWDNATKQFDEQPDALFAMAQESMKKDCEEEPYFIYKDTPGANVTITEANGDESVSYIPPYPIGTCSYNSGVMFAHLKRWQEQDFPSMVSEQVAFASKYNIEMPYGDQGILNAMAARFPERLMELSCVWNMRTDVIRECLDAFRDNGGGIVHGNRGIFSEGEGMAKSLRNYLVRGHDVWEEPFASIVFNDIISTSAGK